MRTGAWALSAAIAAAALLALYTGSSTPVLVGRGIPAPDFSLPDQSGEMVALGDFRGVKVLLITWASW